MDDDDDDGNFTKWMSSYWGHGGRDERAKERKRSFRRSRQSTSDRRASLPCVVGSRTVRFIQDEVKDTDEAGSVFTAVFTEGADKHLLDLHLNFVQCAKW